MIDATIDATIDTTTGFWYIIHIYSGHEKKVEINLQKRVQAMRLDKQILEVIVPIKEVAEVKNGKRRVVERPSYPGYILIKTSDELKGNSENPDVLRSWQLVRETPSVMGFIGSSSNPVPLNEEEVNQVLNLSSGGEKPEPILEVDFVSGDQVRVIEGPFKGFPAEVNEVDRERQRLHLTISIFGRSTPIDLEFLEVEKI